jgi:ATP-dependent protease HslVU (ClpYQ) peptidase subunit
MEHLVTCIVAVEHAGGVTMGADRAGSNGHSLDAVDNPKIVTNGPILVGYCGSFRMGQLLEHALVVPTLRRNVDPDAWVTLDLMGAVRAAFKEHGWAKVENGVAEGGSWLLAVHGRAYQIQEDYSAIRSAAGDYAIGSGTYHAEGSLHTTRGQPAHDRVAAALEAAAHYCVSVQGPFDYVTQERT